MSDNLLYLALMGTAVLLTAMLSTAAVLIRVPNIVDAIQKQLAPVEGVVRLVTVLAIVGGLCGLCAAEKIQGDATVAALSAIAGYVLGNGSRRRSGKAPEAGHEKSEVAPEPGAERA